MIKMFVYKMKNQFRREFEEGKDISKDDLLQYIKKGVTIVDVRSPQEYEELHLDGAICIPEYELKRNVENILKNKNEIIILYCSSGQRSKRAQKILNKMGYANVYNLYDGID